jgi:hypothetical protein
MLEIQAAKPKPEDPLMRLWRPGYEPGASRLRSMTAPGKIQILSDRKVGISDRSISKVYEEPALDQSQEQIQESKVNGHGPPDLK